MDTNWDSLPIWTTYVPAVKLLKSTEKLPSTPINGHWRTMRPSIVYSEQNGAGSLNAMVVNPLVGFG